MPAEHHSPWASLILLLFFPLSLTFGVHCSLRAPSDSSTYRRYTNNCIYLSIYLRDIRFQIKCVIRDETSLMDGEWYVSAGNYRKPITGWPVAACSVALWLGGGLSSADVWLLSICSAVACSRLWRLVIVAELDSWLGIWHNPMARIMAMVKVGEMNAFLILQFTPFSFLFPHILSLSVLSFSPVHVDTILGERCRFFHWRLGWSPVPVANNSAAFRVFWPVFFSFWPTVSSEIVFCSHFIIPFIETSLSGASRQRFKVGRSQKAFHHFPPDLWMDNLICTCTLI